MKSWEDVPGWFDWEWIYEDAVMRARPNAMVVEIGSWFGRSAAYFGQSALRHERSDITLFCVDTWEATSCNPAEKKLVAEQYGGSIFEAFRANMRDCGLIERSTFEGKDVVIPYQMLSLAAVHNFDDESLDLVFVDGDHSYEGCLADIKAWLPKVRPGGIIAGHDLDWPGVAKAVEEVFGGAAEFCSPRSWRVTVKPEEKKQKLVLAIISNNTQEEVERAVISCARICDEWLVCVDPGDPLVSLGVRGTTPSYPGKIVEMPWVDHGVNRSRAISIAEGMGADYVLMIDATANLEFDEGFELPMLTAGAYSLLIKDACTMHRPQLFRAGMGWHYVGPAHEYPMSPVAHGVARLDGVTYIRRANAHGPEKFLRDAEAFKKQLAVDPTNSRAQHYLAQSLEDAGKPAAALVEYAKRAEMAHGWREETFIAKLRFANLCAKLEFDWEVVVGAYLHAWEQQPTRAEPITYLARYCTRTGKPYLANLFAQMAESIPLPGPRALLVDPGAYATPSNGA